MNRSDGIMSLLEKSYSVFHVVSNIEDQLKQNHFTQLKEEEEYHLELGGKYYVKRNSTSIIAFQIPRSLKKLSYFVTATHNDSPTFKLKPNPVIKKDNLTLLNVEPYGGLIYNTWLDRPLSFAGRVIVKKGDSLQTRLLNIDEDLLIIPNLAIHMNRQINSGYVYNPSKDLIPIFGITEDDFDFKKYLESKVDNLEVISHDLFLYSRVKPRRIGYQKEFLGSPRLDDLASTYSSLLGFLSSKESNHISVYASFDNEEVGSLTRQGANSTFFQETLRRIAFALGKTEAEFLAAIASSMMLSIDNAHANHPNYPEFSDRTTDVHLNEGIVIKYNANQSYTSDSFSSAILMEIAKKEGLKLQSFTNRSDLRGGSTLGNLSNSEISLTSVDIGIPQLAMHSSYELLGVQDLEDMVRLTASYFSSPVRIHTEEVSF